MSSENFEVALEFRAAKVAMDSCACTIMILSFIKSTVFISSIRTLHPHSSPLQMMSFVNCEHLSMLFMASIILTSYAVLGSTNSIHDSYPDGIAHLVAEPDISTLDSWQQLPKCYKDICEHICTITNLSSSDITHQHKVTYSTTRNEGQAKLKIFYYFSLRLQLFLGRHNLGPLGNWNGSVFSCSLMYGSYAQQI